MEDEEIEVVKNWHEPKLMRDIQVFLSFANFYWRFIQSFRKIAQPFASMLQTSSITKSLKNLLLSMDVAESDKVGGDGDGDCKDGTVEKSPRSKNSNWATGYLTLNARQVFT